MNGLIKKVPEFQIGHDSSDNVSRYGLESAEINTSENLERILREQLALFQSQRDFILSKRNGLAKFSVDQL